MVDEVKKGNRTTSTFNKAGWNNIQREFNEHSRCQYSLDKFKNRVFKLKKRYGGFKKPINQTGFGWDNVNNKIIVHERTIWEDRIKEHPDRGTFRKDGFPLYPQLCVVFGDIYALGEFASGNVRDQISSPEGDNGVGDEFASGVALGTPEEVRAEEAHTEYGLDDEHQSGQGLNNKLMAVPVLEKHKLNMTPNSKRRRKSTSYEFASTCKAIQESLQMKMAQSSHISVTSQAPLPE
ncbi:uncharacterized protein LOC115727076 [Rhodamnia argentea]|uniref:Uncharacterized protein LOC115727076 n=1 Tax=Rhodamnia argentea TaxID=178133 RepID=A0A8B8MSM9_9MYRT|nr:uncharacterized protein LOC115727076 [Rhodamnia argentea]